MSHKFFPIIYFFCIALMVACSGNTVNDSAIEEHNGKGGYGGYDFFILHAINADRLVLSANLTKQSVGGPHIKISLYGQAISDEDLSALRKEVGDIHKVCIQGDSQGPTSYCTNRFTSIEVTSNQTYNDIPAGEDISSKFTFLAGAILPSIENQWGEYGSIEDVVPEAISWTTRYLAIPCYPLFGTLTEIKPDSLYLLEAIRMFLFFKEIPEQKEHTFTVTFKEADFQFSNSITVNFTGVELPNN